MLLPVFPVPQCGLFCEVQEGACYLGVVFDEVSIVARKAQELPDLPYGAGVHPCFHFVDLSLFHLYYPFRYSYAQKIEVVLLEGAFLQVEVEVIPSKPVKNLPD